MICRTQTLVILLLITGFWKDYHQADMGTALMEHKFESNNWNEALYSL